MNQNVTCVLNFAETEQFQSTIRNLNESNIISQILIVSPKKITIKGAEIIISNSNLEATETWKIIAERINSDHVLIYTKTLTLNPGQYAIERLVQTCDDSGAGMVYSDYFENKQGKINAHPVIDYQDGSLRDDFNFGSLTLYKTSVLKEAIVSITKNYKYAALYDLRLKVSQKHPIVHLPELLYTEIETDTRKSGEKIFDYVDPRNRERQIEMEQVCTEHLKAIDAYLEPKFKKIVFPEDIFPIEASVIIPVRNRVNTIGDAIDSVLKQKTSFKYNLIIIDNHSTDGTSELIKQYKDNRLVHIIPKREDLGIGGCWNEGIAHEKCGKFAIQLDSDDLYIDDNVISRIVNAFYEQNCAMVIGSYQMVNFKLKEIPPGLIDHKEWTPENGRNNALRINGLGAPRAFYTPVIRDIKVPNTSYGEDYAIGLNISRYYQIGRIYEPLYLCRRWEGNSDASLDIQKMNSHNFYKDKLRTIELKARQQYILKGQEV